MKKSKVTMEIDSEILQSFKCYCEVWEEDMSELIEEVMLEILKINAGENEE